MTLACKYFYPFYPTSGATFELEILGIYFGRLLHLCKQNLLAATLSAILLQGPHLSVAWVAKMPERTRMCSLKLGNTFNKIHSDFVILRCFRCHI